MASGLVRSAISEVAEEKELHLKAPRAVLMRETALIVLEKARIEEKKMEAFDKFSEEMVSAIRDLFDPTVKYRSVATKREKLWIAFQSKLRVNKLPKIWLEFLKAIEVESRDQLFQQSVNQKLFELMLREHFAPPESTISNPSDTVDMTTDELNALQYAAGYVPHALLRRFEKRTGNKYEAFIECLGDMAVSCDDTEFFAYTKKWINTVNRGGLFPLNDITYQFFVAIERQVKVILPEHAIKSSGCTDNFKQNVINKIMHQEDVQWHWTLISQSIDSEEDAIELLYEIVLLWVTVRGFALAATWMETYKQMAKATTKRSVSLRKKLKSSEENSQ